MKWTYDTDHDVEIKPGQYIASIGAKGVVVSVWLIQAARPVQHKKPRDQQGWVLEVTPAPEAKPGMEYDSLMNMLWFRGEPAHPFFWYPRSKK